LSPPSPAIPGRRETHDLCRVESDDHRDRVLAARHRGVATRRFAPADPDVALHASGGSLLAVMRATLEGELGADAEVAHAEGVLRTLGVDPGEAVEVARRALPQVS
jgi:hypothetical protein